MRLIRELPFPILIVVAVLMLGAPFVPEPHLIEKLRMLSEGTLVQPIDIFDLLLHTVPLALLAVRLWRNARRGRG